MENFKLLRLPQVIDLCGLQKSAIYKLLSENRFPKPVKLGPRAVAWRSDEVGKWITDRPRVISNPLPINTPDNTTNGR